MLVGRDFVFLHQPKTGGTFVTRVLKELLCPSPRRRWVHGLRRKTGLAIPGFPYRYRETRKHAFRRSIPLVDRGKRIVGCVRHPCDLYVSDYKFGYWQKRPDTRFEDLDAVREAYPSFPDLSFEEFVHCADRFSFWSQRGKRAGLGEHAGWYSTEFVSCFAKDKDRVLRHAAELEACVESMRKEIVPIRFLRQSRLNEDLARFVEELGFPASAVESVHLRGRIYPGRGRAPSDSWRTYFTPELEAFVRRRERLVLDLFPELDEAGVAENGVASMAGSTWAGREAESKGEGTGGDRAVTDV